MEKKTKKKYVNIQTKMKISKNQVNWAILHMHLKIWN